MSAKPLGLGHTAPHNNYLLLLPSISIDPKVAAAYTRGPERVILCDETYLRQRDTDK